MENIQYSDEKIRNYINEAIEISKNAYAPYSKLQWGCLIIDQDDQKHYGINVENSSYGLSVSAECNAICSGVTQGLKKIKLIIIYKNTPKVCFSCGASRQLISEFSDQNTIIICSNQEKSYCIINIDKILPGRFTTEDLFSKKQ